MDQIRRRVNAITLYQPTTLLLGAFRMKGVPFTVGDERPTLIDIPGPGLEYQDQTVVGEAAILGWLDRRYPHPELFPSPLEEYAKASTLAHALTTSPELCRSVYYSHTSPPIDRAPHRPFLLGQLPNIADLALWVGLNATRHPAAEDWGNHIFAGAEF